MTNHLSKEMDWFLFTLEEKFGVNRLVEDIGVEAVELGMDEIEEFFIPREVINDLPAMLIYEIMVVEDDKKNEWVGAIGFYPESPKWCLQVITKNSELVYRKPQVFTK